MSTTEAKQTNNGEIEDLDVIVVGAGFALDRLRSMDMAVQVFETGAVSAVSGIGIAILGPALMIPRRDHRLGFDGNR